MPTGEQQRALHRPRFASPQAASLDFIQTLGSQGLALADARIFYAGAPVGKAAPGGMGEILAKSEHSSLGVSGGLTLTKSAAAFVAPEFKTTTSYDRTAYKVNHYAVINRTTPEEVEHESYYPLAGNHFRPGMVQQIQGKTYKHYWVISAKISELIKQGEQEHLDDAHKAFELTYGRIADEINSLAGKRFGPASTPSGANALALAALESRLPKQLGTDPANWVAVLDRLLDLSKTRDTEGWHALTTDPPQTVRDMILHPVSTTATTQVGTVSSKEIVKL